MRFDKTMLSIAFLIAWASFCIPLEASYIPEDVLQDVTKTQEQSNSFWHPSSQFPSMGSVFSKNLQVVTVSTDPVTKKSIFKSSRVLPSERRAAEDGIVVDRKTGAVKSLKYERQLNQRAKRNTDGKRRKGENQQKLQYKYMMNSSDSVDTGRRLTMGREFISGDAVIEFMVVLSTEVLSLVNYTRNDILHHFAYVLWALNTRLKSLTYSNVTMILTGLVLMKDKASEPFVWESRAEVVGQDDPWGTKLKYGILRKFSEWVSEKRSSLPKHDVTMVGVNNVNGGIANMYGPCNHNFGEKRSGATFQSMTTLGPEDHVDMLLHELGHSIGAPHDAEVANCTDTGYSMSGGGYFFSSCSDKLINEFIRSREASCLRTLEAEGGPLEGTIFDSRVVGTMEEQCKLFRRSKQAFLEEDHDCSEAWCKINGTHGTSFVPMEHTPCGDGKRCYNLKCRDRTQLVINVGYRFCLRATNLHEPVGFLEMKECPAKLYSAGYMDGFAFVPVNPDDPSTVIVSTPYINKLDYGQRCVIVDQKEGNSSVLVTRECDPTNSHQHWEMIDVGSGEFLLKHETSKRCARLMGSAAGTTEKCDPRNKVARWKRL